MKNLKNLLLFALLGLTYVGIAQCNPGVTANSNILIIVNNRSCDVMVNWEVSDCIVTNYCNSTSASNGSGKIIIPANSTYTVNVSLHYSAGPSQWDCTWYTAGNSYDIAVFLFEIDYDDNGGFYWGGVSNGCGGGCFSFNTTNGGANSPASCPANWSMTWANPGAGVTVTIN